MFHPIRNYWTVKRSYVHGSRTFYTAHHLGIDLIVKNVHLYAPVSGMCLYSNGKQGGKTLTLNTETHSFRFLHLSKIIKTGEVKAGELIGVTGNTGLSTGAHLHHDIYDLTKGRPNLELFKNFIDPDKFYPMFTLIKGDQTPEVYALDQNGERHHIINEATFDRGRKIGMWGEWTSISTLPQSDLDKLPLKEPIIFGIV